MGHDPIFTLWRFQMAEITTCWDVPDDSPVGYILEVDLMYPDHLHELHQDLPFCPKNKTPPGSKEPRLLTTLYMKERYVIHLTNTDIKHYAKKMSTANFRGVFMRNDLPKTGPRRMSLLLSILTTRKGLAPIGVPTGRRGIT